MVDLHRLDNPLMTRMICRTFLSVVALVLLAHSYNHQGSWTTVHDIDLQTDRYAHYYKWYGPPDGLFNDTRAVMKSYRAGSPCRALTIRDNCFSHNPARAHELLRRQWHMNERPNWYASVSEERTLPQLISEFHNKSIAFLGDSTVLSVFTSLVCYLGQNTTSEYRLIWLDDQDQILQDVNGQTKCPYHTSCYVLAGVVHYPEYGITVMYDQINSYTKRCKALLYAIVDGPSARPDVVVINMGIHYNDRNLFVHEMWQLKGDLKSILQRQKESKAHNISWHWLESFPQHFAENSYFTVGVDEPVKKHTLESLLSSNTSEVAINPGVMNCRPHPNTTQYYHEDWRNRLTDVIMPEFHNNHRMIRIAEPLYEQWDAHVDYGDSRRVLKYGADCTHYCTGSGVFRFVLSEVLSGIRKCLHSCPDKHFFTYDTTSS